MGGRLRWGGLFRRGEKRHSASRIGQKILFEGNAAFSGGAKRGGTLRGDLIRPFQGNGGLTLEKILGKKITRLEGARVDRPKRGGAL